MSIIGGSADTTTKVGNSTDPTAGSKAAQAQSKLQENLDQFLHLLVTQLKNQDPLNPMDSTQFTTQLVQFASVEQQIYTNANMEKLLGLEESSQVSTMVNFIGKGVEATTNKAPLQDSHMAFTYTLPQNAKSVQITIQNDKGLTVFFADGDIDQGQHGFTWDGTGANGQHYDDGAYSVVVTAKDASDNLMTNVVQTSFGKVTGAGVDNGTASLFMGDVEVPMDKILTVKEADSSAGS
jgi:flagellar basal-body rod modification protein FlgD